MSDDSLQLFLDGSQRWAGHERKFSILMIQFSGTAFAGFLGLLLFPGNAWITLAAGLLMWFSVVWICLCGASVERCRQWQDWHAELLDNPTAWPWPPMPSHL